MAEPRDAGTHWDRIRDNADQILNVREEIAKEQSSLATLVLRTGHVLAMPWFFVALLTLHVVWIAVNIPSLTGFEAFDPYPFPLIAMIASAEAPFLALLILAYQRENARIAELREEMSLQVALHLERQNTAVLRLLVELQEGAGIETKREDTTTLEHLLKPLDPERLMRRLRRRLSEDVEGDPAAAG